MREYPLRLAYFFSFLLLVLACGSEREIEPKVVSGPAPAPQEPGTPPSKDPTDGTGLQFTEVAGLMQTYCVRCHTGEQYISNEAAFLASQAQSRVASLNMPVPTSQEARNLSAADRAKIANYKK